MIHCEAMVPYFGKPMRVACDGNCAKAWGINRRPKVQLSADEDDVAFLADHELPDAPADPGTYEGGFGKPADASHFPNKWCVRECERCYRSKPGENDLPPVLPDFARRRYNLRSRASEGPTSRRRWFWSAWPWGFSRLPRRCSTGGRAPESTPESALKLPSNWCRF